MLPWNKDHPELFAGTVGEAENVVNILKTRSKIKWGKEPEESTVTSWEKSLPAFIKLLNESGFNNHGLILELELPGIKDRLDGLLVGQNSDTTALATVIEYKGYTGTVSKNDTRDAQLQVGCYQSYLEQFHSLWTEHQQNVLTHSCVFFHEAARRSIQEAYDSPSALMRFHFGLKQVPSIFGDDETQALIYFLKKNCGETSASVKNLLKSISEGIVAPSQEALDLFVEMLEGHTGFLLTGGQRAVCDRILTEYEAALRRDKKTVTIIRGGPGTGKTVLAVSLLAAFRKMEVAAGRSASDFCYATPGGGTIPTLHYLITEAVRKREQSSNLKGILKSTHDFDGKKIFSMALIDESHRQPQEGILPCINAARFPIFFIDERQAITPGCLNSADQIQRTAEKNNCVVWSETLSQQLRYRGGDAFLKWIDGALQLNNEPVKIWERNDVYPVYVYNSVNELYEALAKLHDAGEKCRMTAGFTWKTDAGVRIKDFHMPWYPQKLDHGVSKNIWSVHPSGWKYIGAPYFTQNFEFDFVGVVIGPDITFDGHRIHYNQSATEDYRLYKKNCPPTEFPIIARNIYRMLLTRGRKGCLIYAVDPALNAYLKSCTTNTGPDFQTPLIISDNEDLLHSENVFS